MPGSTITDSRWKNSRRFCGAVSALILLLGAAAPARAGARAAHRAPARATKPHAAHAWKTVIHERGVASWYGRNWRGRRTASGARFNDRALTAAHPWLPFATRARVTNLANGRSVEVVITDRGPHCKHRIIDLSAHAAKLLGMKKKGVAEVSVTAKLSPAGDRLDRVAMR